MCVWIRMNNTYSPWNHGEERKGKVDKSACSDLNKYFNVEPATMNGSREKRKPTDKIEFFASCKWQRKIHATFYRRLHVYSMG